MTDEARRELSPYFEADPRDFGPALAAVSSLKPHLGSWARATVAVSERRRALAFALENSVSTEVADRRRLLAICCVENPAAFKAQTLRSLGVSIASTWLWSTRRSRSAAV